MSWIKFKEKYLFTVNFSIMLGVILYGLRKDFTWHPLIMMWFVLCLVSLRLRNFQNTFLHWIGRINSTILLGTFYFLFFTPFSLFYRLFYRNKAFVTARTRMVPKDSVSSFDTPF